MENNEKEKEFLLDKSENTNLKNDSNDNNENNNFSLIDKNQDIHFYFPKRMIQKIEQSSYIITLMESLSQIYNFSHYFFKKEMPKMKKV